MKLTKLLILALMLIAFSVYIMQVFRWKWAFLFVALYWLVLTVKNYCDWRRGK